MTPERWQQIDHLFHSVLERPQIDRAEFLEQACQGDKFLRSEVESLIECHEQSNSFIERPAEDLAAELLRVSEARLRPGQALEHYTIVSLLGTGGMGEVYLARDEKLGRQIAIKLLPTEFTNHQERVRRFELEARAASALNHPNIVTIYEIGQSDSSHFIAAEFIDGQTLRQYMATLAGTAEMEIGQVLDIAIQIGSALAAAHSAGIVHRDIKPENIMLRADGLVKVLDFGLAKLALEQPAEMIDASAPLSMVDTNPGLLMGTVRYMSPEQAKGSEVDHRTDIWSLGVVIYEMITGRTPFRADSASETLANLRHGEPIQLNRFTARVPDELQSIVSKMLARNRDQRYQTMTELLAELRALKENLAFGQKLKLLPTFQNATRRLGASTTEDNITSATQHSLSLKINSHKPLAILALAALFICVTSVGYYFLFARKSGVSAGGKKSIAVLPVKPINTANRDEIYEIGIADSLIHRLSSMKGFIVRPLSATRKYADIEQDPLAPGQEQKADYVLASNYQLVGGKIRITAQLFNVANGQIEETYQSEKDTANVFAMQDAIAGEVGNILLARFGSTSSGAVAKRGTTNEEAYRLYLQGMYILDKRNLADARHAVEIFEQAVRIDPNYGVAWAGKAHAHRAIANFGRRPNIQEEYQKSIEAINKALALDESLADAHSALCENKMNYEYDYDGAERECKRAIELDPNSSLAHQIYSRYLMGRGRFDEAIVEIKIAIDLEPASLYSQRLYGNCLYNARRYEEAVLQYKRVIAMDPNFGTTYPWLSLALESQGNYAEAFEWWMKALALQKADEETVQSYREAYQTSGWQGVMLERAKRYEKNDQSYFHAAAYHAQIGKTDKAFEYLEKSYQRRELWMHLLQVEPRLDSLRGDPRFDELVKRVESK